MSNQSTYKKILFFLLFIFIFLEIGFQTFFKNEFGVYISPVIWMIGGLGTCFVALSILKNQDNDRSTYCSMDWAKNIWITWCIFIVGSLGIASMLIPIFEQFPVDKNISDIIPSLKLYVTRFLGGEQVYAPLDFGSWQVLPTYFPLLWMPYCFSEILEIDYRWTAYLVFLIAIAIYNFYLLRQDFPVWENLLKAILPFAFLFTLVNWTGPNFGMAVELLPSGFYLILCLTVLHRSYWAMGIGILLCLMSRYAFTFWLPIYFLIIWLEKDFWTSFKSGLVALAGVIIVYIIPFFAKDPAILTNGLKYYKKTAETQWEWQYFQKKGEKPFHLIQGLSYAIYFYDYAEGEVSERLDQNRKVHIIACGIAALLLLLGYFYYKNKGVDPALYMIIALKFYLVIFYGFFYVPFSYLFMIPLFLSLVIVMKIRF